jgi:hypothetical protein
MLKLVFEEFRRGPAATVAAYVAIASAVVLLFSAASVPSVAVSPTPVLVQVPMALFIVGVFAFTASYGAAYLLNNIGALTTRFFASMAVAVLVQSATAVLARHMLGGSIELKDSVYERTEEGVRRQISPPIADIAGIPLDSFVLALSLILIVVFVGMTIGRMEKSSGNSADNSSEDVPGEVVLWAGVAWVLIVFLLGGSAMEAMMRAGL